MSTLTKFYATFKDLKSGLTATEESLSIDYVKSGMFPSADALKFESFRIIPSLGICASGDQYEQSFLVVNHGAAIIAEPIAQRRGGVLYAIDHRLNAGIVFRPGGLYGNKTLIAGELGTPRTDFQTQRIFKTFNQHFWIGFIEIGAYQVGPEALRFFKEGGRLTQNAKWSPKLDLKEALL